MSRCNLNKKQIKMIDFINDSSHFSEYISFNNDSSIKNNKINFKNNKLKNKSQNNLLFYEKYLSNPYININNNNINNNNIKNNNLINKCVSLNDFFTNSKKNKISNLLKKKKLTN